MYLGPVLLVECGVLDSVLVMKVKSLVVTLVLEVQCCL